MNKNEIVSILKKHDIDNEKLASALAEIFENLATSPGFKDELADAVLDKMAKDAHL
ncbi:hypothetical protein [Staphylococcus rostri]|uniref:hypothetical protein n=1 Tax=Staphylococcus rostri TaxID=522262 RepID=UPI002852C5CC|nr:hypothetical protein [Staphylococcus rostri]